MDFVKASIWGREWHERCSCVPMYLRILALEARSCPAADISIFWPHIVSGEQFLGSPDARMEESMKGVENIASETLRYKWARVAF